MDGLNAELASQGGIIAELNRQLAQQAATIDVLKQEAVTAKIQIEIAVEELEALAKELAELKKTPPTAPPARRSASRGAKSARPKGSWTARSARPSARSSRPLLGTVWP